MSNLNQKNKNNRGFTLIEMLVAVSIFSMSIIAFMTVLSNGISDANYSKNKTIATFLSAEGIEYIRNMRDTFINYDSTPSDGWQHFKEKMSPCVSPAGCSFDDFLSSYNITELQSSAMNISKCDIGNNCSLYYYPNIGRYSYNHSISSGANSGFTRVMTVDFTGEEVKISSTVSWMNGATPFSITFSDNLLKWKE